MRYWLKPQPLLFMIVLFVAPVAALAHLLVTWVPQTTALQRLREDVSAERRQLDRHVDQLLTLRAETTKLREMSRRLDASAPRRWLAERDRNLVSDVLANVFESRGTTVDQMVFESPSLLAITNDATSVLACESLTLVCHGGYEALTGCLDALPDAGLPLRTTYLSWKRGDGQVELTMGLQVPFAPDKALADALRAEAGIDLEEDLDAD